MPCDGSLTPREPVGKLDVLVVESSKYGRTGRYAVRRLVERCGRDVRLFDWLEVSRWRRK